MDTYRPPTLTVDTVVFRVRDFETLEVLLIKRAHEPFAGKWALPGGYCAEGETTREAMERILTQKTGVAVKRLPYIEQLYTFDTVARDPRGHAVSVCYMALGHDISFRKTDTAETPTWHTATNLPKLAFDHKNIVAYARKRLQSKLQYTNAAFSLLPKQFTLSQLRGVYETVLEKKLDKRNFRKKILQIGLIKDTGKKQIGAHRPARLYTFKDKRLVEVEQFF